MLNKQERVDKIFEKIKKEIKVMYSLKNINLFEIKNRISRKLNLESSTLITDIDDKLYKDTFKRKEFINNIKLQNKFFEIGIENEIKEKMNFKVKNKLKYKELNQLATSSIVGIGVIVIGSLVKVPIIITILGAIICFGVTYYYIPKINKIKLENSVNRYLDNIKMDYVKWIDNIEKYYNKRVDDIIKMFGDK